MKTTTCSGCGRGIDKDPVVIVNAKGLSRAFHKECLVWKDRKAVYKKR